MVCQPTNVPDFDGIDLPALRTKYAAEKAKRLKKDGQAQYVKLSGNIVPEYATDPHNPVAPRDAITEELDVLVMGAGWGGIMASYYLAKQGVTNVRNVDTAGDFGGVWYWNRYPGIQCDNDSYCYLPILEEMGFMPTKKFSDGAEIQAYAKSIATKFGFADKALFHTQVTSLKWDEAANRWHVGTNRGDTIMARFVVVAAGVLNMPKLPSIAGIDTFKGKMFHTARWDYSYTGGTYANPALDRLADKRVAIIGTGATAIQAVPNLAKYAKQLYVIQRTPSTVDERPNPATDAEWVKSLEPGWQRARMQNFHRAAMEAFHPGDPDLICDIWTEISRLVQIEMEKLGWPQLEFSEFMALREKVDARVMERLRARTDELVKDQATADALKPWYRFLCKRPLASDTFYPVFNQDNVELVDVSATQGLERMTPNGFVANGKEYEIDCMIFASGFEVTSDIDRRWGIPTFEGRDGKSIYQHWANGPLTLHGLTTVGFPNQFYIGYIQGASNANVTEQFGRQGAHAAWIIAECLKRGVAAVEPSQEGQDAYLKTFNEILVDVSEYTNSCPPGYFNNEGEADARWALFKSWGYGWDHFENMLHEWREEGSMAGMVLTA